MHQMQKNECCAELLMEKIEIFEELISFKFSLLCDPNIMKMKICF